MWCVALLVLVNEKNCCVEIYLERKIPAMLMGEGVSNVPPRFGSAAVAAPMRRERHLAIGCNRFGGTVRKASPCGAFFLKLVLWSPSIARRMILRLSQTGTHGTVFCSAPIRMYCPEAAVVSWANELMVRCEPMQTPLTSPYAYAFKAALHIAFDVLHQMALMPKSAFEKLMRDIERRSGEEPSVVERALSHTVCGIDEGKVVMFSTAFYAACRQFQGEKAPQMARGTWLVRSVCVTHGRLILRPAQVRCEAMQRPVTFPCAYAFKAALHIAFDVLHQMALMPKSAFEKLMRDIERRSEEEPSVVERALSHTVRGIDEGKVVTFSPAFYAECRQCQGEKAPQLARGTCLVRSVFVTPGRLILRPALEVPSELYQIDNRILSVLDSIETHPGVYVSE
ncbi:hypothetical protein HPB50_003082 [Hyalomma asiaticum]|uniref:Uncharacterized protein n=1 Tax=Hyalomma asiaticum TaxID=266040 RepID=A0ACB7TBI5_HYAAI|nr:hypothetical protein HPB50_003082 [Hyalomma asiaticum]